MTEPLHLVAKNGERLCADTAPTFSWSRATRDKKGTHSVSLPAHLTHIMLLYPPSKPHTYKQPHPCQEPTPKRRAPQQLQTSRYACEPLHCTILSSLGCCSKADPPKTDLSAQHTGHAKKRPGACALVIAWQPAASESPRQGSTVALAAPQPAAAARARCLILHCSGVFSRLYSSPAKHKKGLTISARRLLFWACAPVRHTPHSLS